MHDLTLVLVCKFIARFSSLIHLGVLLAYSLLLESKLRWVQVLLALNGLFVVVVPLV